MKLCRFVQSQDLCQWGRIVLSLYKSCYESCISQTSAPTIFHSFPIFCNSTFSLYLNRYRHSFIYSNLSHPLVLLLKMRLPVITAGITLLLAALGRADDDCDSKDAPFADSQVAGQTFPSGPDNTVFCQSKWSAGETIVGIEAWSAKFQVKAIRFKFSQTGWGPTLGTVDKFANQAHQVKEWGATDEVGM